MYRRIFSVFLPFLFLFLNSRAQEKLTVVKDLRAEWMAFEAGSYRVLGDASFTGLNTVYITLDARSFRGNVLRIRSHKTFYVFLNGKVGGEFTGEARLPIDSLFQYEPGASFLVAIHQNKINERDLRTEIVSHQTPLRAADPTPARPYWHFRDFVVLAGLVIILLFVVAFRSNPKLTAEYFSVARLLSARESSENQLSARLTGSSNVQFFVLCSLLIGYYLLIVFYNLPSEYALPIRFHASDFGMMWLQWFKVSGIVFFVLVLKMFLIFSLTRLFAMHGVGRFHFFNWIRLLLLVFGVATTVLFTYFIGRGSRPDIFVMFLSLVVVALIAWAVVAFFKLSDQSGHSMFHLFSYLCATEIIPLLITVKILFQ